MNCKNCGEIVEGNFCASCGQSTKIDRINLAYFLSQLSNDVFQINKGLFYTLKELSIRPGHSIRDYLFGKRKNHFPPIAYAFTLSTIYFLLTQFVEGATLMNDFVQGFTNGSVGSEIEEQQIAALSWFAKNYAYTILMLIPIYSLASYLAFWGSGFNYLEHFILNAFVVGQLAIFYSLSSLIRLGADDNGFLAFITICLSTAYTFWVFWQFFSEKSRVAVILRSVLSYALNLILMLAVILIVFRILSIGM
jgi:hypothetical protein